MGYVTDIKELSQSSIEIDVKEERDKVKSIVDEIKCRMTRDNLTALSAPQIGEKYRIFCIKFLTKRKGSNTENVHVFINPVIVGIKGIVADREEDICIPNKQFIIFRNNDINLTYQDINGENHEQKFSGKTTSVIQLMVDHLDGILLSDIGLEIDGRFDKASEEEKNELLLAYAKALGIYKDEVNKEIESTPELKEMSDAVRFIQSVRSGETNLGSPITVDTSELQKSRGDDNDS